VEGYVDYLPRWFTPVMSVLFMQVVIVACYYETDYWPFYNAPSILSLVSLVAIPLTWFVTGFLVLGVLGGLIEGVAQRAFKYLYEETTKRAGR
jgi:hypothetical protein